MFFFFLQNDLLDKFLETLTALIIIVNITMP